MLMLCFISISFGQRPDEGGLFAFSSEDQLDFFDFDQFRVHYSAAGPNQVLMADEDGNEIPDFVEDIARLTHEAWMYYEAVGFRTPLLESAMGIELGGSSAFDIYLVDFGGSSDGMFGVDACDEVYCSGFMIIENDFAGYGYSSIDEALSVLVSHELFHGVQYAYFADQETWMSEGMAVWAEHLFESEVRDFISFSAAYLSETERSLNRPPAGSVTAFSYGTALWFAFVQEHYGVEALIAIQEELASASDNMDAVFSVLGSDFEEMWILFTRWNLATGPRSGAMQSYPYSDKLYGIQFAEQGTSIMTDHRFYPLSASYFQLEHSGGPLQLTLEEPSEDLVFSLHPTLEDRQALEALDQWSGESSRSWDLEAGRYFLVVSYGQGESSQKLELCLANECVTPSEEAQEEEIVEQEAGGCGSSKAWFCVLWLGLWRRRS